MPGKESYEYDGHGRRVVMWRSDGTASVPMYGRDGRLRLTADNGLGGATYHVYLGDDNVADVFARWSDGLQTTTYLHTDALGSPIARTDQARNISRTEYAPYGETVSTTGATPSGLLPVSQTPSLGVMMKPEVANGKEVNSRGCVSVGCETGKAIEAEERAQEKTLQAMTGGS